MQTSILLTVIVPVYNAQKYLLDCMRSIQKQRISGGMEVICIDDGSTDKSSELLKKFASSDERFYFVSQLNQGVSSARNVGLDLAKGKFVTFVDADDIIGSRGVTRGDELQKMLNHMTDDIDVVIGAIDFKYEADSHKRLSDANYYSPVFNGKFLLDDKSISRVNCSAWAKVYRKSLIDQFNIRFPVGLNYEDAFWWFSYAVCAKSGYYVKDKVYTYCRHPLGIMNRTFESMDYRLVIQHIYVIEEFYKFLKITQKHVDHQSLVIELFETYLNISLNNSKLEDRFYILWKTGEVLRRNNIDINGSKILMAVKSGNVEEFNFDPLLVSDAQRWRKLNRIFDQLCPRNSLRRSCITSLIIFLQKFLKS